MGCVGGKGEQFQIWTFISDRMEGIYLLWLRMEFYRSLSRVYALRRAAATFKERSLVIRMMKANEIRILPLWKVNACDTRSLGNRIKPAVLRPMLGDLNKDISRLEFFF